MSLSQLVSQTLEVLGIGNLFPITGINQGGMLEGWGELGVNARLTQL